MLPLLSSLKCSRSWKEKIQKWLPRAGVKGFNVGDLELQFVMIKSVVKITDGNGFTQNV